MEALLQYYEKAVVKKVANGGNLKEEKKILQAVAGKKGWERAKKKQTSSERHVFRKEWEKGEPRRGIK